MASNELGMWLRYVFDYHPDGYLVWKIKARGTKGKGAKAGSTRKDGYVEISYKGLRFLLHQGVYAWHHGSCPPLLDHKDTDNSNNRIDNLRESDKIRNGINSNKISGAVPYRGVYWAKNMGKYRASIYHKGAPIILGYSDSAKEASELYLKARENLYPGLVEWST